MDLRRQLQAKDEKRERHMKCHRIQQYFGTDKSLEWALLSWPDRPTRVQKAGESKSAKRKKKQNDALALEVVQWRYPRAL
jgi:hypothetical protein